MQCGKDLACWVKLMLMTQHKSRYIVWNTTAPTQSPAISSIGIDWAMFD